MFIYHGHPGGPQEEKGGGLEGGRKQSPLSHHQRPRYELMMPELYRNRPSS